MGYAGAGVIRPDNSGARIGINCGLGSEVIDGLGGLEERRPILGIFVKIRLTEEGRGLGSVEHAVRRLFIGSARGGELGKSGGRRSRHIVAHDILWRDGLNV